MSRSYTPKYNDKCMALGKCRDCGKPKEPERIDLTLCVSCAKKRSKKERDRQLIRKGSATRYWVPVEREVYPVESCLEVLVTDIDGLVYALEKSLDETWDDIMADGIVAWRGFPKPYQKARNEE